ncbi:MAG TPA: hypothetical protein VF283_10540 [Bryobacteraceae bacterium]
MPSKAEHIAKAEGNEAFASEMPLTRQPNIDWALVAIFYAAVHYVEAYFSLSGTHLRSHTTRDRYVGRDPKLKPVFREYSNLKYYAYNARYEATNFKPLEVTEIALPALDKIKAQLKPLFQSADAEPGFPHL